ncbi:hypothetical protein SSX86_031627 [Deinandra increscens subsp. villosa]|uniref:DUF4283 domain-containing protein n=1 Tax=Deinandra increscens subsp. villosa TaxID=3103831 RepID=A0AAP0C980_9ASTR
MSNSIAMNSDAATDAFIEPSELNLFNVNIDYSPDLIPSSGTHTLFDENSSAKGVIDPSIMNILTNPSDDTELRIFNKFLAVELLKRKGVRGSVESDIDESLNNAGDADMITEGGKTELKSDSGGNNIEQCEGNEGLVKINEVSVDGDTSNGQSIEGDGLGKVGKNSSPMETSVMAKAGTLICVGNSEFHDKYSKLFMKPHSKTVKSFFLKHNPIVNNMTSSLRFMFKRKELDRSEIIAQSAKIFLDLDGEAKHCVPVSGKKLKRTDPRTVSRDRKLGVGVDGRKLIRVSLPKKEAVQTERSLPPVLHVKYNIGKDSCSRNLPISKDTSMKYIWSQMKKAKEKVGSSTSKFVQQLNGGGFKESVLGSVPAIKNFVFGNSSETATIGVMNGGSYASVAAGLEETVQFCPPVVLESGEKVVMVKAEVIVQAKQLYRNHLYGHFVGSDLSLAFVRFNLYKMWKKFGIMDIQTNGAGIFLFKFDSEKGMNAILESGPWVVNNVPLCIKRWEPGVNMDKSDPVSVPTWILIKGLPMELWNTRGVCQVASCVGKPILFDKITQDKCGNYEGATGFARVLVEVIASEMQPCNVRVLYPQMGGVSNSSVNVSVEYQAIPAKCEHCQVFGHSFEECKLRPVTNMDVDGGSDVNCTNGHVDGNANSLDDSVSGNAIKEGDDGFQMVTKKGIKKPKEGAPRSGPNSPVKRVSKGDSSPSKGAGKSSDGKLKGSEVKTPTGKSSNQEASSSGTKDESKKPYGVDTGSTVSNSGNKRGGTDPKNEDKGDKKGINTKQEYRVKDVGRSDSKQSGDKCKGEIKGGNQENTVRMEYRQRGISADVMGPRIKLENRFESLQSDDMSIDSQECKNPVESVKAKEVRCAKNEVLCNKHIKNFLLNKRRAEANSGLVFGSISMTRPPDLLTKASTDNAGSVFDDFFELLEKQRKDEVLGFINAKQFPSSDVMAKWSHLQTKFFLKMCEDSGFEEGFGLECWELLAEADGSDGYFSATESEENEVASVENEMANFMKIDSSTKSLDTQALGVQSSLTPSQ